MEENKKFYESQRLKANKAFELLEKTAKLTTTPSQIQVVKSNLSIVDGMVKVIKQENNTHRSTSNVDIARSKFKNFQSTIEQS